MALDKLAINEELGDVPTHFMKSGSCMPPKDRLDTLLECQRRVLPKEHRGAKFEFDLWFNTNELRTIRNWLYTDFLGGGIFIRVNTIKINDRVMHSIADSDIKIDEERIDNVMKNLQNKYYLHPSEKFYEKVIFLPGSNLLCKPDCIDIRRVEKLVEEGYVIKPHPITAHIFIAELRAKFGYDKVLGKKEGGHELLLNATEIATAQNSEMGIVALLLGKDIRMVSHPVIKLQEQMQRKQY